MIDSLQTIYTEAHWPKEYQHFPVEPGFVSIDGTLHALTHSDVEQD